MKIAIIGCGVTGGALSNWLKKRTMHDIIEHDPGKDMYGNLTNLSAAFLCLPVPTLSDGSQDYSILESYLYLAKECPVFIRSTILPDYAQQVSSKNNVYHVPEFLTERRSHEDMASQPIVCSRAAKSILGDIFITKEFIVQSTEKDCAIVKYAHNCFGAMKINFFNNIYKMSDDYEQVKGGFLSTGYINKEHTNVPGPDGKMGYGGKCFLKDMYAFAHAVNSKSLLETVNENYKNRRIEIGE